MIAQPWLILAAVLAFSAAVTGAYIKGRGDGRNGEIAERATLDEIARVSRDTALQAAAEAISQIEVKNVTHKQTLEREIVRVPDYSRCVHSASGLSVINAAITGIDITTADSELPSADAPHR